jgi:hypothetical protein
VEQLLDPGSFQEVGSVSGTVKWKQLGPVKEEPEEYVPSNNVQGMVIEMMVGKCIYNWQASGDYEVERLYSRPMTFLFAPDTLMALSWRKQ